MTHGSGEHIRLQERIEELENRLKEKETYHADCLRIKQLENQVEGYKGENGEQFERIEELEQQLARYEEFIEKLKGSVLYDGELHGLHHPLDVMIKEFEREQND